MRAFIAYSLERDYFDRLRERLNLVSALAQRMGIDTYAHIRDAQCWVPYAGEMAETLEQTFQALRACDLVIADFTAFENKNRTGLKIECGFAKALYLPIVSLVYDGDRPRMLADLADFEIRYKTHDDIEKTLPRVLSDIMRSSHEE